MAAVVADPASSGGALEPARTPREGAHRGVAVRFGGRGDTEGECPAVKNANSTVSPKLRPRRKTATVLAERARPRAIGPENRSSYVDFRCRNG